MYMLGPDQGRVLVTIHPPTTVMLLRTSSIVLGSCALPLFAASCALNSGPAADRDGPRTTVGAESIQSRPIELESRGAPTIRQAFIASSMHDAAETFALHNENNRWVTVETSTLGSAFDEHGVGLWGGSKDTGAWAGRLKLRSVGREQHALEPLPPAVVSAKGNRVELGYPGVVEWYLSGPLGLEQGINIQNRPAGDGPLVVEISLDQLSVSNHGERVALRDTQGIDRVSVTDLLVRDARGQIVPSRFDEVGGYLRYVVDDSRAQYPIAVDPLFQSFEQKLTVAGGTANSFLGTSVAISGNTAAIGCPSCDSATESNSGAVYVFIRNNGLWALQKKVLSSTEVANAYFGSAVALDGDTLVVGAKNEGGTGKAYVLQRVGTTWGAALGFSPAGLPASAGFGTSVAIDGDILVIGAPGTPGATLSGAGSLYISVRNGGTWGFLSKVTASSASAQTNEHLGDSVAISGNTIVAGASYADVGGNTDAGAAYVFLRNGSVWSEQAKLTTSAASAGDRFGYSVGLFGDTTVIGAPFANPGGTSDAGAAVVFERTAPNWVEKQTLYASDKIASAKFGISVSLSQFLLGVGANTADPAGKADAGEAYVFAKTDSSWGQQAALIPSDSATGMFFGGAVAVSEDTVIVGAASAMVGGVSNAGAAYVYRAYWTGQACLTSSDCNTGFCVDGVCCDNACGNSDPTDCQACSIAAGAASDGVCAIVQASANHVCRSAVNDCDIAEVCDGVALSCPADALVDVGTPCDDGDLCTTDDTCSAGICSGAAITCDPLECYSAPVCNPLTGACESSPDDSLNCTDNDACTSGDHCEGGVCVTTGDVNCDDGNLCTTESCDSLLGCQIAELVDGSPCDMGTCQAGECVAGAAGNAGSSGTAGSAGNAATAGTSGASGSAGGGGSLNGGSAGAGAVGGVGGATAGTGPGGADGGHSTGGQSAGSGGDSATAGSGGNSASSNSGGSGETGGTSAFLPANNAAAGDEGSCSMTQSRSDGWLTKLVLLSAALVSVRRKRSV